ncbi:hypothetical protein LZ31DRAFT_284809 [Colletotrichum somersetense]|nr:hypothetical protein LZ31DRAFT_284809 [Colletotrichum somersetense]
MFHDSTPLSLIRDGWELMLRKGCCTSHAAITERQKHQVKTTVHSDVFPGSKEQNFAWRTACALHKQPAVQRRAVLHLIPSFSNLATGSSLGQLQIQFLATGLRHGGRGVFLFYDCKRATGIVDDCSQPHISFNASNRGRKGWFSEPFCHQYQLCIIVFALFAS